jgi:inhibitor of KinA sporulation pathway (predicted exonuclease)
MLHERFDMMSYIVLDLEWNQAMSSKSSIFNKLPIHLSGEIIQIGAVKLDEAMVPSEEFQADVKPIYFRRMHYKVKKLTGFDKERLSLGRSFTEVFEDFRAWCGPDAVFITWGYDDRRIMEQNIIIHDLDWDWIGRWINLQLIYNIQTGGDKNQKALSAAMEHFCIEQTRMAHDALGDAYNTAIVCSSWIWRPVFCSTKTPPSSLPRGCRRKNGWKAPRRLWNTASFRLCGAVRCV